ncbi:5801_t:CDS:10 [Cetraspora pellucida]|uniref:5801_t:CDS:1 n=1 Tax=Cetraspora pellucida TaxID=1433469 RepID=A0A9N8WSK9_9GLOM|nr:5801_t:CDS:10 [Cetraspora pellucida]
METVYAVHNFYGENDDELTFKVGDPILVLEKDEMYWDGCETSTIPEAKIQVPSANETIVDIQTKLHQLVAKKHQKNNSDPNLDTPVFKSNSAPNLPIHRSSTIAHLQTSSQRQSKGSLRSGHSSLSLSSGSNHSEYSNSRNNISRKNSIKGNPLVWNVEQVCQWLKEKGFDSVIEHFIENDITGDILLGLDLDSLKELNIMSYGKRIHIMNAINALKSSSTLNKDQGNADSSQKFNINANEILILQLHPIMESTPIMQSKPVDISDKVDTKDESSLVTVNSNGHSGLPSQQPQQINHTDEKFQAITEKVHKKKSSRIFSKLNFTSKSDKHNDKPEKNETNQNIFSFHKPVRKEKSQSPSGGWDLLVDTNSENKYKNKPKSLSKKMSREHLDRNSLVGSQLGLPKYAKKNGDKHDQINRLHSVKEGIGEEDEETFKHIGTPDYEGWLMKQDDKYKSWKNRFCVLKKQTLFYFQSDKIAQTPRLKGTINIMGYRIIPDENILQGKYGFKLVHDTERAHYFAHENLGKIREWLKAIMKATISRDPKSPVFSSSDLSTMSLTEARKLVHKQSESTNKNLDPPEGTDSPTLERSLSPTLYPPSYNFNRSNPQQPSPRCRSVSPLPEISETSGQPTTMSLRSKTSSTFKKLVKSTSFDSITASYM